MNIPNDIYKIDIKNYRIIKNLGHGGFGKVNLIQDIKTNKQYAAKEIVEKDSDQNIFNEINILIRFQHPTIVKIIGYSKQEKDKITIIMKYMEKGSLYNLLQNEIRAICETDYDNTKRQIILIGIAYGMTILHQNNVIHRDLKPENVLLDESYRPFISDFGLSKVLDPNNSSIQSQNCGSWKYMAPEAINSYKYGRKVDVYSFGILMYEIISGKFAFEKPVEDTIHVFHQKVIQGLRPTFDVPIKKSLKKMIEKCWEADSKKRPTFIELFWKLSLFNEEEDLTDFEELNELKEISYEPVLNDIDYDEDEDDDSDNYNKKFSLDNVDFDKITEYFRYISIEKAELKDNEIKWIQTNIICKDIFQLNPINVKKSDNISEENSYFLQKLLEKINQVIRKIHNGVISTFYFPLKYQVFDLIYEKRELFEYKDAFEILTFYSFYSWIQINLLLIRGFHLGDFSKLFSIFNYIFKITDNVLYKHISFSCNIDIINLIIEHNFNRIFDIIFDQILIFITENDVPDGLMKAISHKLFQSKNEYNEQKVKFIKLINQFLEDDQKILSFNDIDDLLNTIIDDAESFIFSLNLYCLEFLLNSLKHVQIRNFDDILKSVMINLLTKVVIIHNSTITENSIDNISINQIIQTPLFGDDDSDHFHPPYDLYQIDKIDDLNLETNITVSNLSFFFNEEIYPIVSIIENIINLKEEYALNFIDIASFNLNNHIFVASKYESPEIILYEQCAIIFHLLFSVIKQLPDDKIQFINNEYSSIFNNEHLFNPNITYFTQNSNFDIINSLRHFIFLLLLKRFPKLLNTILISKCNYPVLFRECVCRLITILNNYNNEKGMFSFNPFNFFSVTETLIISLYKYGYNSNLFITKTRVTIVIFFNTLMQFENVTNSLFLSTNFRKYFFILLMEPFIRQIFIIYLTNFLSNYYLDQDNIYFLIREQNNFLDKICQNIVDVFEISSKELPIYETILFDSDLINILNEAMKFNDKLINVYIKISSIFHHNMLRFKHSVIINDINVMPENSQKVIFQKLIQIIASSFKITQPKILSILIEIFMRTNYVYDAVVFISDLCYHSSNNCIKCHESGLDLFLIDTLYKWRQLLVKMIPENSPIIENNEGLIISEKLINLFLLLFFQIASVVSSVSIVEKFINLLQPVEYQYFSLFHNNVLQFLYKIIHESTCFPMGAFPLIPLYSFGDGVSFVFWISIASKVEIYDILDINDDILSLKIQLIGQNFNVKIQSGNRNYEYNNNIATKSSEMVMLSSFYDQENAKFKLNIYFKNDMIMTLYCSSLFTPIKGAVSFLKFLKFS